MTRAHQTLPALLLAGLLAGALAALPANADQRPLPIEEALALARATSEAVRIKGLEAGKAADRLVQARARRFPNVALQASGSYLTNPPEGVTLAAGELGTIALPFPPFTVSLPPSDAVVVKDAENTYFTADITLSQPVFTWGKISAGVSIAGHEVAAAGAALAGERRDVERQVQTAYFGALLAEKSLGILEEMRETAKAVRADRKRAFEEGEATRQEVLEAEAALASVEARLVDAQESRATARDTLSVLTGVAAADIVLASGFRTELPPLDEQALKAAALARSPELAALRGKAGQARAKLDLEEGGGILRPDLSLSVSLGVTGQTIPWLRPGWTDTWDWDLRVSLGTRATLFDAGTSRAKMQEAGKDVEAAGLAIARAEKLIGVRVRTAVQQARRSGAALVEARARAAFLREQVRNARVSFENEIATRGEMNSAILAHLSGRLEELRAEAGLETALEEIDDLVGRSDPRART